MDPSCTLSLFVLTHTTWHMLGQWYVGTMLYTCIYFSFRNFTSLAVISCLVQIFFPGFGAPPAPPVDS
jgi:hypothetical protein